MILNIIDDLRFLIISIISNKYVSNIVVVSQISNTKCLLFWNIFVVFCFLIIECSQISLCLRHFNGLWIIHKDLGWRPFTYYHTNACTAEGNQRQNQPAPTIVFENIFIFWQNITAHYNTTNNNLYDFILWNQTTQTQYFTTPMKLVTKKKSRANFHFYKLEWTSPRW